MTKNETNRIELCLQKLKEHNENISCMIKEHNEKTW
jgi:hypothetical protein